MTQLQDPDLSIDLAEPHTTAALCRPRPDPRLQAVEQVGDGPEAAPAVYIDICAVETMLTDARDHGTVETGGLLVGALCEDDDGQYVRVVAALPASGADRTSTSLTFTHEAWNAMLDRREALFPDWQVVGWYHTHPGMRCFLSEPDQFIHRTFFRRPEDIAVVVDLQMLQWAVFHWRGEGLELAGRFYVYGEKPEDGARLPAILRAFAPHTGGARIAPHTGAGEAQ